MAYTPRSFTNKPGVLFDADKTSVLFAEDINYIFDTFNEIRHLGLTQFWVSSADGYVVVDNTSPPELVWGNVLFNPDASYNPTDGTYYVNQGGFYHFDFNLMIGTGEVDCTNVIEILLDGVVYAEKYLKCDVVKRYTMGLSITLPIDAGVTVSFTHSTSDTVGVGRYAPSAQSSISCHCVSFFS